MSKTSNEQYPPISRYPNLCEEIKLRQFMSGHVAKAANITEELLAAALFKRGKLSDQELYCMANALKRPFKYLKSPKLHIFGTTQKEKRLFKGFRRKVANLIELWHFADESGAKISYRAEHHYQNVSSFYEAVVHAGTSTMAQYYLAYEGITYATRLIRSDIDKANKATQPPRGI